MTEQTPLERLDNAVHEFVASVDGDTLHGWTLAWQTSKISDEPEFIPLMFASDFTMSASTSPETALGLASITAARIKQHLLYGEDE